MALLHMQRKLCAWLSVWKGRTKETMSTAGTHHQIAFTTNTKGVYMLETHTFMKASKIIAKTFFN